MARSQKYNKVYTNIKHPTNVYRQVSDNCRLASEEWSPGQGTLTIGEIRPVIIIY